MINVQHGCTPLFIISKIEGDDIDPALVAKFEIGLKTATDQGKLDLLTWNSMQQNVIEK